MAITTAQIRNMLNRPRGLVEDTITEYVNLRTREVDKKARDDNYEVTSTYQVTDALKEDAVKLLTCVDCLLVLVGTIPLFYPEQEQAVNERRFKEQLKVFQERANAALALIEEKGGTAFAVDRTNTRVESTSPENRSTFTS